MELPRSDVDVNKSWQRASNRGGRIARTSRAAGLQTGYLELVHRPTGLKVNGTVPEGQYTRKEMMRAMDGLQVQLQAELTKAVEQKLRLPGR
jgi:hypothetical protein